MKGLVLAIVMGSLFATTKRANRLTHIKRQILMVLYSLVKLCQFLLPLYVSFKVLHFYIESHAPFILISFLLPVFILSIIPLPLILIGMFIISDWLEFLVLAVFQSALSGFIMNMKDQQIQINFFPFMILSLKVIALFVLVFSFFEKVKKEQFVLNYTNTKTRKIFL